VTGRGQLLDQDTLRGLSVVGSHHHAMATLTKDNKDNVSPPVQLASLPALSVKCQIDDTAQDATAVSVTQPVGEVLAPVMRLWVTQHNGSLGSPKEPGGDTAGGRAEIYEPLGAVTVVGVQRSRVEHIAGGTEDKGVLETETVGDDTARQAGDRHEREEDSITRPMLS